MVVTRLSRERAKQSTLDFAERRRVETAKAWVGRFFLASKYPFFFTLAVMPGVGVFGGTVSRIDVSLTGLKVALVWFVIGAVTGGLVTLFQPGLFNPLLSAMAMLRLGFLFGYFAPAVAFQCRGFPWCGA